MTQAELDRQVSRRTGESVRAIRQRGFSLLQQSSLDDDEPDKVICAIDWDEQDAIRRRSAA